LGTGAPDPRLAAALDRFEAIHRADPRRVSVDGVDVPWSVRYHGRLGHWVERLDPDGSAPLRLAAACQHIRRWDVPRGDYAEGRLGYRRWRTDLAKMHARIARDVLAEVGYDDATIVRVEALLRKVGLGRDPEVQRFEDAICMVFFEMDFVELAGKHEDEKMLDILRKTWAKMSDAGHRAALGYVAELPARERALVVAATSRDASPSRG
jgi:Domain of unknown function (DUF4202)